MLTTRLGRITAVLIVVFVVASGCAAVEHAAPDESAPTVAEDVTAGCSTTRCPRIG